MPMFGCCGALECEAIIIIPHWQFIRHNIVNGYCPEQAQQQQAFALTRELQASK